MKVLEILGTALLSLAIFGGCLEDADLPKEWACNSNSDCLRSEKCVPDDVQGGKRCKPADFCRMESDCAADEYCTGNSCLHAGCKNDSPCGAYSCNTVLHECYTQCFGHQTCSGTNVCAANLCVPPQCSATDSSACQGYLCDAQGACLTSCDFDESCAGGYSCVNGSCQLTGRDLPCTSSTECIAPYSYCDVNVCALPCTQRSCPTPGAACGDCGGAPSVCGINHFCRTACAGFQCGMDGDVECGGCTLDKYCVDNQCVLPCQVFDCGYDRGVFCGNCTGNTLCEDNLCVSF